MCVAGCKGGAGGVGRSATMLYQDCGIWLCGRLYCMVSMGNILQGGVRRRLCRALRERRDVALVTAKGKDSP